MAAVATAAGHFYRPDGTPAYTVIGKNGKERNTTIKDCREMGLYPSVTEVLKIRNKGALNEWFVTQALEAAYDSIGLAVSPRETWIEQVRAKSKEYSERRRDEGTALHGAIERFLLGQSYDPQWAPHIEALQDKLSGSGIDLKTGQPEKSLASPLGFAGKIDWHNAEWQLDFKSKDRIDPAKQLQFDEHRIQNHGYQLMTKSRNMGNVFIGVQDKQVVLIPDTYELRYVNWFLALLTCWRWEKNYFPSTEAA